MSIKTTLFVVTLASLFALPEIGSGQEVNSDVSIPPPSELASGAGAVTGVSAGINAVLGSDGGTTLGGSLASDSEAEVRGEVGDFMTSLLVRAGMISFDAAPGPVATTDRESGDRSRPVWIGATLRSISVGRTAPREALR
jgi:hypothetical protein